MEVYKYLPIVSNFLGSLKLTPKCPDFKYQVQWESEYQISSVFEWSIRGWMQNGPVIKYDLNTGQPDHFKTGQMNAMPSCFPMY